MGTRYRVLLLLILVLILQHSHCFTTGNGCPEGTVRFREHCYISSLLAARYDEAEAVCKAGNGNLVIITDADTQLFVQQLRVRHAMFDFYIGITDKDGEGNWTYSSDNSPVKYFKWYPGEPNNYGHGEDCVTLRMKHLLDWNDVGCKIKNRYICQYEGEICKSNSNYVKHGNVCYEQPQVFRNFEDANTDCKAKGGFVASPRNSAEHLFIKNIIYEDKYWLNLTAEKINNILHDPLFAIRISNAWIGIKLNAEINDWINANGQPLEFSVPDKPENTEDDSFCAYLDDSLGVSSCANRYGFVCQYPAQYSSDEVASKVDDGQNLTELRVGNESYPIQMRTTPFVAVVLCSIVFGLITAFLINYVLAHKKLVIRWPVDRFARTRLQEDNLSTFPVPSET